jgi:hypothetical protein
MAAGKGETMKRPVLVIAIVVVAALGLICLGAVSQRPASLLRYSLGVDSGHVYILDTATGELYYRKTDTPLAGVVSLGTVETPDFRVVGYPRSIMFHDALTHSGVPVDKADRFVLADCVVDIKTANTLSRMMTDPCEPSPVTLEEIRVIEFAKYACLSAFAEQMRSRLPKEVTATDPDARRLNEYLTSSEWLTRLPRRLGGSLEEEPLQRGEKLPPRRPKNRFEGLLEEIKKDPNLPYRLREETPPPAPKR